MGGRTGVTYDDIAKAIPKLQELHKNPTVDNIREHLGTGSKSTIARLLREWKAQHGLPPEDDGRIPSDLAEMVKSLWDRLKQKADTQITDERQQFETRTIEIQQQLHQEHRLQRDLQQKNHALEEQLHKKTEETKQLKATLIIEQQEKIKLTERVTSFESRRQENLAENERLHQLLKHAQDSLEHYQAATQQLRQDQSLLIEKQRNEYEQKLIQWQTQAQTAANKKSMIETQYQQLRQTHEVLEKAHNSLVLQQSSLKIAHDRLQQDCEKLNQQYQEQAQQLEAKQHTIIELQVTLKAGTNKIAGLEETIKKANDKVDTLRHDLQFVSQEKANLEGQFKQLQTMLPGRLS